jgi:LysM repeat protein
MNFSFDSVKPKSKLQNEDFFYNIETPRGHFFAVLDFASHDYANLNATLTGKLETIVGSFDSLSNFSDNLFLGFLAKEINNFVSNLAEQSAGPELLCSAALCLVSGDRLSYLLCGDVPVSILSGDSLRPLQAGAAPTQLGARNLEAPMSDQIRAFTLQDADIVLIMTQGIAEVFEKKKLPSKVTSLAQSEPKLICESLMKGSSAAVEDRTVVVIGGPYERQLEAVAPNSSAFIEFKTSLASLEARLDAFAESETRKEREIGRLESSDTSQLEERFSQEVENLKDELRSKAPAIDLLELDEKLKALNALLVSKADTAQVLGLQRDVLKLGLLSTPVTSSEEADTATANDSAPPAVTSAPINDAAVSPVSSEAQAEVAPGDSEAAAPMSLLAPSTTFFTAKAALLVIAVSLAAGFAGGWLHSPGTRKGPEVWTVKSSSNQIVISRLDAPGREDVTINVAEPVKVTGEQTFSSFADVRQYIDAITSAAAPSTQTNQGNHSALASDGNAAQPTNEITIKSGDTLQKLSQVYNVPPERLMELNPSINRWPSIKIGQKIFVPAGDSTTATTLPAPAQQSSDTQFPANTTEVTIGPGDSLNQLARRFNTTADRIKELNPNITNWLRIQRGQKVIVPAPAGG